MQGKKATLHHRELDREIFGAIGATRVFGYLSLSLQQVIARCWHEEEFLRGTPYYPWGELRDEGEGDELAEQLSYMQFEQDVLLTRQTSDYLGGPHEFVELLRHYKGDASGQAGELELALLTWRARTGQKGWFPGGLTLMWLGLLAVVGGDITKWYKSAMTWAKQQLPWLVEPLQLLGEKERVLPTLLLREWRTPIEGFDSSSHLPLGQLWLVLCLLWQAGQSGGDVDELTRWRVEPFLNAPPESLLMALCQDLLRLLLERPTTLGILTIRRPARWERWLCHSRSMR